MEKGTILSTVASLPEVKTGLIIHEDQVWRGQDGAADFMAFRRVLPAFPGTERGLPVLSLIVGGNSEERQRVAREFSDALGRRPVVAKTTHKEPGEADSLLWIYHDTESN